MSRKGTVSGRMGRPLWRLPFAWHFSREGRIVWCLRGDVLHFIERSSLEDAGTGFWPGFLEWVCMYARIWTTNGRRIVYARGPPFSISAAGTWQVPRFGNRAGEAERSDATLLKRQMLMRVSIGEHGNMGRMHGGIELSASSSPMRLLSSSCLSASLEPEFGYCIGESGIWNLEPSMDLEFSELEHSDRTSLDDECL